MTGEKQYISLKASRLNSYGSALTAGLRLQRLHIRLAAQRHDRDLAGAEIRKNYLHWRAVALQKGNVARLRATRRQIERGPDRGLGIVAQRPVGAPQIGPDVVLAVDRHVVRLLPAGERHVGRLVGARVDAGKIGAPRVADPQHVGVLVGAHPPRSLRPRERIVEVGLVVGLVELARLRADAIHLRLHGSELDLLRLARCAVAFADDVESHFRPPAVAVAIAGGAVGYAGAVRGLVGDGFELGEGLGRGIEPQRSVRRGRPDPAFAVVVDGGGAAGRRHSLRRHIDVDALALGIEAAQTAAAVVDVEPDDAVWGPGHAVGLRGETVHSRHLEQLDLAGLAIDLADGGAAVRDVAGEPELPVEIEPGVMHAPARDEDGRRAERPIAAVVLHEVVRQARVRIERHVVLLEHDARRLPGRTRIGRKPHGAFAGSARAREIGRQFLLMVVENAGRLALVTHERAVVGILHQLDDGVPAGLVEPVLKRVARGVTAGANIAHEPFHALVLLGLLGQ